MFASGSTAGNLTTMPVQNNAFPQCTFDVARKSQEELGAAIRRGQQRRVVENANNASHHCLILLPGQVRRGFQSSSIAISNASRERRVAGHGEGSEGPGCRISKTTLLLDPLHGRFHKCPGRRDSTFS